MKNCLMLCLLVVVLMSAQCPESTTDWKSVIKTEILSIIQKTSECMLTKGVTFANAGSCLLISVWDQLLITFKDEIAPFYEAVREYIELFVKQFSMRRMAARVNGTEEFSIKEFTQAFISYVN